MDELNGRMIACQVLITGLIARVASDSSDPLRFLTDFRDEIKAVVKGVNIAGMENTDRVRLTAQQTVDELFFADEGAECRLIDIDGTIIRHAEVRQSVDVGVDMVRAHLHRVSRRPLHRDEATAAIVVDEVPALNVRILEQATGADRQRANADLRSRGAEQG